jgi:hypothetical protein
MSREVYLLSIPLARHRAIVPRPRRVGVSFPESGMREPELRTPGAIQAQSESPVSAGPLRRIEPV